MPRKIGICQGGKSVEQTIVGDIISAKHLELNKTCVVGSKTFTAPGGWKFQDCEARFVSMMRVKNAGDWTADLRDPESYPDFKDDYISADPHERNTWEIVTYDRVGGHGGHFIRASKRSVAIKEMICLAESREIMENVLDANEEFTVAESMYKNHLGECRKKNRVELWRTT